MMKKEIALIIPSYEPNEVLTELINELKVEFKKIIVIDDGSNEKYKYIYNELKNINEVILLKHNKNLGKGRALKTAFNFYLNELSDKCLGVVTLDSDGQHKPTDVKLVAQQISEKNNKIIMGARNFKLDYVPLKSKLGNLLTIKIMDFFCGVKTKDTQTGLRGLGNFVIEKIMDIQGERFEYETNVLLEATNLGIEIEDIDIETVYLQGNKGTHFNPIIDSLKIYRLIFKFILSGAISAVFDLVIFWCLQKLSVGILISNLSSRFISSILNFTLNKKMVFKSNETLKKTVIKYYVLVLIMGMLSTGLIKIISILLKYQNMTFIKIFVELFLFFISFSLQNKVIFKRGKK